MKSIYKKYLHQMKNFYTIKQNKKCLFFLIIYAVYILLIFCNSMDPADISSEKSGAVLLILNKLLFGGKAVLTEHIVRKLAHFAEYTVAGIFGMLFFRNLGFPVLSLFSGLLVALTDETIQLFVPGRSGQITDVWLDFSGILAGSVMFLFLSAAAAHLHAKRIADLQQKI